MNYEVREECHSKFEDPVPEEKKNICEYEDVSCLFAWWKRRGQELLHVKENKARKLVLINIKYVEYFEFVKERVKKPHHWWTMVNFQAISTLKGTAFLSHGPLCAGLPNLPG